MKHLIKAEKLNDNLEIMHFSLWFTVIEEDSSKYNHNDMNNAVSNAWLTEFDIERLLKHFKKNDVPVKNIQVTSINNDEITFDVICETGKVETDFLVNKFNYYYDGTQTRNFGNTDECIAVFDEVICSSK